jgi:hypothetical protein
MARQIEFRMTLKLGGRWSGDTSLEELKDHIRNRMNTALGFRAQVTSLRVTGMQRNPRLRQVH